MLEGEESTAGRSVIWGDPSTAPWCVIVEGIETAAAVAYAFRSELRAQRGHRHICDHRRWHRSLPPMVGHEAHHYRGRPGRGTETGEARPDPERRTRRASLRGTARRPNLRCNRAPGSPGTATDWLDVHVSEGTDAVRTGILSAVTLVPTPEEVQAARERVEEFHEIERIARDCPLPKMDTCTLSYQRTASGKIRVHRLAKVGQSMELQPIASAFGVLARLRTPIRMTPTVYALSSRTWAASAAQSTWIGPPSPSRLRPKRVPCCSAPGFAPRGTASRLPCAALRRPTRRPRSPSCGRRGGTPSPVPTSGASSAPLARSSVPLVTNHWSCPSRPASEKLLPLGYAGGMEGGDRGSREHSAVRTLGHRRNGRFRSAPHLAPGTRHLRYQPVRATSGGKLSLSVSRSRRGPGLCLTSGTASYGASATANGIEVIAADPAALFSRSMNSGTSTARSGPHHRRRSQRRREVPHEGGRNSPGKPHMEHLCRPLGREVPGGEGSQ